MRGIDFELAPLKVSVDQIMLSILRAPDRESRRHAEHADAREEAPGRRGAACGRARKKETAAAGPPAKVRFGRIALRGGSVNFSDFFIKPNYTVALSGVEGAVSEMTPDKPATSSCTGASTRPRRSRSSGRSIRFRKDLFVGMKASVKDIDLPPVTPYSVSTRATGSRRASVGEGRVPHRESQAHRREQHLPRPAHLRRQDRERDRDYAAGAVRGRADEDRNGVIDVDLPISGSLDDPQFSVGGIVVKALVNLLTKAVTAPFALIGALVGGGGEELAYIEFAPARLC